ncbi:MAG: hypothetical protein H0X38_11845, partial [Planctomycetes bacterium]|nr:hypothetical protein [Planctomycetota bacterium]
MVCRCAPGSHHAGAKGAPTASGRTGSGSRDASAAASAMVAQPPARAGGHASDSQHARNRPFRVPAPSHHHRGIAAMTMPSRTTRSTVAAPPLPALPHRPKDGHKGTFGTVVVIGGCATMLGAPCFCALGALRSGAGLVRLAVPSALLLPALSLVPSAIGIELPERAGAAFVAALD